MASVPELIEAQNQVFMTMLGVLTEIRSELKTQSRAVQGASAADSTTQAPAQTSPSAGQAASGKSDAQKAADKRSKVFKGIATETAGRLADPFEPRGLAVLDAAQGILAEQLGAGVANLAFNASGVSEQRFIQQQTFNATSSDAANLAAMNIKIDPAFGADLAKSNQAFSELLANNLKAAASGSSAAAASDLAQKVGISPEAADAIGKAAGLSIGSVLRGLLGGKDDSPIKSNRK